MLRQLLLALVPTALGLSLFDTQQKIVPAKLPPGFPYGSRVAIVIRGKSFHYRHGNRVDGCNPNYTSIVETQRNATRSLRTNVIQPLLDARNIVEVFYTDSNCTMQDQLKQMLAPFIIDEATVMAKFQSENLRFAVGRFKNMSGGYEKIEHRYGWLMITRHDLIFKQPITSFEANYSKLIFPARCEVNSPIENCANDVFWIMPSRLFRHFDRTLVGTLPGRGCFHSNGHNCFMPLENATDGQVDFAVSWRPQVNCRDSNPWFALIGQE